MQVKNKPKSGLKWYYTRNYEKCVDYTLNKLMKIKESVWVMVKKIKFDKFN